MRGKTYFVSVGSNRKNCLQNVLGVFPTTLVRRLKVKQCTSRTLFRVTTRVHFKMQLNVKRKKKEHKKCNQASHAHKGVTGCVIPTLAVSLPIRTSAQYDPEQQQTKPKSTRQGPPKFIQAQFYNEFKYE